MLCRMERSGTADVEAHDALLGGIDELLDFTCAKATVGTRPAGCG